MCNLGSTHDRRWTTAIRQRQRNDQFGALAVAGASVLQTKMLVDQTTAEIQSEGIDQVPIDEPGRSYLTVSIITKDHVQTNLELALLRQHLMEARAKNRFFILFLSGVNGRITVRSPFFEGLLELGDNLIMLKSPEDSHLGMTPIDHIGAWPISLPPQSAE